MIVLPSRDGGQNLFSLFGRFSLFIILTTGSGYAQSFADFKRVQSESFAKFRDKKDNEFAKYLQAQWQEYTVYISPSLYPKKKPKVIPVLIEKRPQNVGPNLIIHIKKPSFKKDLTPPGEKIKGSDISFNFFGSFLGFNIDKRMQKATFYRIINL